MTSREFTVDVPELLYPDPIPAPFSEVTLADPLSKTRLLTIEAPVKAPIPAPIAAP
jgi:hypothetical protein